MFCLSPEELPVKEGFFELDDRRAAMRTGERVAAFEELFFLEFRLARF